MKDFVLKEFTPCRSLINGAWRASIRAHWWLSLLRKERKSAVPARWPFLPVVRKPISQPFLHATRFLLWRSKCPIGLGVCADCPARVVPVPRELRPLSKVHSALFMFPLVPVKDCVCVLSEAHCVEF